MHHSILLLLKWMDISGFEINAIPHRAYAVMDIEFFLYK